jgi:hypothetical protein
VVVVVVVVDVVVVVVDVVVVDVVVLDVVVGAAVVVVDVELVVAGSGVLATEVVAQAPRSVTPAANKIQRPRTCMMVANPTDHGHARSAIRG